MFLSALFTCARTRFNFFAFHKAATCFHVGSRLAFLPAIKPEHFFVYLRNFFFFYILVISVKCDDSRIATDKIDSRRLIIRLRFCDVYSRSGNERITGVQKIEIATTVKDSKIV